MFRLIDLPQFRILAIRDAQGGIADVTGVFNHVEFVFECRSWLYVPGGNSMIGDIQRLDKVKKTAQFLAAYPNAHLQAGAEFPWIDGYWDATTIDLVLDLGRQWERATFEAQDAAMFRYEGGRMLTKVANLTEADGAPAAIVPGGWDHEHCEICNRSLGHGGEPTGFLDPDGHWLCEMCYQKYAAPHDLSFMVEYGKSSG